MSSKSAVWSATGFLLIFLACSPVLADKPEPGETLTSEYALLRAEQSAAADSQPYFVIDLARLQFQIRMAAVIVWQADITLVDSDSAAADQFAILFTENGRQPARTVRDCHLFEAAEQLSDSLLAIVGSTLRVSPDSLQRLLPQRFELDWPDGLTLTVLTDAAGTPPSRISNLMVSLAHLVEQPFHGADLTVHMNQESALTLFRLSRKGMTTLVIGPTTIDRTAP
jgi:hypothetical protein